jgi:hypothetical protein
MFNFVEQNFDLSFPFFVKFQNLIKNSFLTKLLATQKILTAFLI